MNINFKNIIMSKIKKIIGVIVVTMFLSALSANFGLIQKANAYKDPCPGWDGQPFWGWDGYECSTVDYCTMVCV